MKTDSNYPGTGYLPDSSNPTTEATETIYKWYKEAEISFTVEIKDGGAEEGNRKSWNDFAETVLLYSSQSIASLGNLQTMENVQATMDESTGRVTVTITGLPLYDDNDTEIIYYVKCDITNPLYVYDSETHNDYYAPTYDNTNVANFGSVLTQTYNGGTLELLLKGYTDYTATKYWLDDGTESTVAARPNAELTLWRYVDGTGSYKTAAQVYASGNVKYTQTLDNTKSTEMIVLTASSSGSSLSTEDYVLEKYDQEGYLYVYLARETLSGGTATYEQVLLTSIDIEKETGKVTAITGDTSRESGDTSIYNGGILANRITGEETVRWKKVWKAGNYQTQLDDVEIELTLYYNAGTEETPVWQVYRDSSSLSRLQ